MPTVTATQVIQDALNDLEVLNSDTETYSSLTSVQQTDTLRRLNLLVGQWANQTLTIPAVQRTVFTLLSGKGSSTNPYTIGSGGDLNVARPTFQDSIIQVGLLLNASNPPVEIPRGIYTHNMWEQERIKDLTSVLFTALYYNPTFAGDLGQIFLWPVPTDLTNNLVLYIEQPLGTFADATTSYSIPPGFDDALHFNLALKLAIPYGRPISPDLRAEAMRTLAVVKRANVKLFDLPNEFAAIGGQTRKSWYNIVTGEGSY